MCHLDIISVLVLNAQVLSSNLMCVAGGLCAVGQIFYLSQICKGALEHYCLLTMAGLSYHCISLNT